MNEYEIIKSIKNIIGDKFIGDDCAYISDIGIVITQDSFVEDIHFKREWYSPYQLGYKSIIVNISDILASGAVPKYISIALSLPNNCNEKFIDNFYKGANAALSGAKIIGGDITGSKDKIFISITAIGITKNRNISSRKNAKEGYIIVTKGFHGSSSAGLNELINHGNNQDIIKAHIEPKLEFGFAESISTKVVEQYAMMDTSDGLADALFKIAEASNVKIIVNYNMIPKLESVSKNQVLFGGEDYKLIAAIPAEYENKISDLIKIGYVCKYDGVRLDISGEQYNKYSELLVYNHFNNN